MSALDDVVGVDHLGLTFPDLEEAITFYTAAFGARVTFRLGPIDARELPPAGQIDATLARVNVPDARYRLAMMRFSDGSRVELFEYERPPSSWERPPANNDLGGHHLAVRVRNLSTVLPRLVSMGCTAMEGPTRLRAHRDSATDRPAMAVNYVLDPWGNQLELVERED